MGEWTQRSLRSKKSVPFDLRRNLEEKVKCNFYNEKKRLFMFCLSCSKLAESFNCFYNLINYPQTKYKTLCLFSFPIKVLLNLYREIRNYSLLFLFDFCAFNGAVK